MIIRLKVVSHHLAEQSTNWVNEADASIIFWVSFVTFFYVGGAVAFGSTFAGSFLLHSGLTVMPVHATDLSPYAQ